MRPSRGSVLLFAGLAFGAASCGPAPIRPVSFADPSVPCPAGLITWRLNVLDQRAEAEDSEKMIASIRNGIESSFPGCQWSAASAQADTGTPTITITVFRLGVAEHDRYQDAAAEWNVTATSTSGSTMTAFDAHEEESRPAYSGADEEALNEAFRKALQRTVKGLAAMQRLGSAGGTRRPPSPPGPARPPEGTVRADRTLGADTREPAVNR